MGFFFGLVICSLYPHFVRAISSRQPVFKCFYLRSGRKIKSYFPSACKDDLG